MIDFELKLAFIEYDIAITNINYTKVHGFQFQIDDFEYHC
jgi:hypothetical protein